MRTTRYFALPFSRDWQGQLLPGLAIECAGGRAAVVQAHALAEQNPGAIAFFRGGASDADECEPAEILASFGEVPEDLSYL